jgi:5-deoxy-glucuronate isomerase
MYYLNILAGPGERTFGFCDDPAHHWVRATWDDAPRDPRVPLYGHENLKN